MKKNYKKLLKKYKGGTIEIDGDEEIAYIIKKFKKIDKEKIIDIIELYYELIKNGSSNPEDYYEYISNKLHIGKEYIKNIFDIQLEFLIEKGVATAK
jgi:hypothetical protein